MGLNEINRVVRIFSLILASIGLLIGINFLTPDDVRFFASYALFGVLIIVGFLFVHRKGKALPDIFETIGEKKRTEVMYVTVTDIQKGVDKKYRPYVQVICSYKDSNQKVYVFKSKKVLGKLNIGVGDKCKLIYQKNNYRNYLLIPSASDMP